MAFLAWSEPSVGIRILCATGLSSLSSFRSMPSSVFSHAHGCHFTIRCRQARFVLGCYTNRARSVVWDEYHKSLKNNDFLSHAANPVQDKSRIVQPQKEIFPGNVRHLRGNTSFKKPAKEPLTNREFSLSQFMPKPMGSSSLLTD